MIKYCMCVYTYMHTIASQVAHFTYLLSSPIKLARSDMWFGRTELRMGPFLLCTVTIHIQYSLWRVRGGIRGGKGLKGVKDYYRKEIE